MCATLEGEKVCAMCLESKPRASSFRFHPTLGWNKPWCNECENRFDASAPKVAKPKFGTSLEGEQTCAKCGECKPVVSGFRFRNTMGGFGNWCNDCQNRYDVARSPREQARYVARAIKRDAHKHAKVSVGKETVKPIDW
jgi:hypothetical protein